MNLNGTHWLLVYADYVNILGGSVHTIKENADALEAASREIGLEVNADRTKYMVMSQDENAGRSHNIKTDSSSFGRVKFCSQTLLVQQRERESLLASFADSSGPSVINFIVNFHPGNRW